MNVISVLNIGPFLYSLVRLTFGVSPIASETFYQRDGSEQPAHPHISNQSLCYLLKLLVLVYPQCVQQRLIKPTNEALRERSLV